MTQRFQQSIWPRRHRLLPIVDLDSQHGLDVVILGLFTRGHCEEDSCLAFVEGRKKVLVQISWMDMDECVCIKFCLTFIRLSPPIFLKKFGSFDTTAVYQGKARNTGDFMCNTS